MMKLSFWSIFLWLPMSVWAQNQPWQSKIDSLYQKQWRENMADLDSLDVPKIVDLKVKRKDSIVLKTPVIIRENEEPITPFSFMNTIKERQWFFYGQNHLIFNQSSYSHWNTGGNNSIGVIGRINYSLSYKNRQHFWDNQVKMGYGMLSTSERGLRKTEDYMQISSKYGYDLGSQYYLLMGMEFSSQFSAGYHYSSAKRVEYKDRVSRFMAPAYLNLGLGLLYNPNENFQVSLSPINGKFTLVLDPLLQKKGRYGLERDGQSIRKEMGALMNVLYRVRLYKDIHWVHQLNLFSSYTKHPERVDIAYNSVLTMKFNKWISTTLSLDLVYDHDQARRLQMKQVLGVGLSYNLGIENKEKNIKKDKVKLFL